MARPMQSIPPNPNLEVLVRHIVMATTLALRGVRFLPAHGVVRRLGHGVLGLLDRRNRLLDGPEGA